MESGVLFVDDDPAVRQGYAAFGTRLKSLYDISIAGSGAEGIQFLKRRRFDVVVTDLTMPNMNGMEFLRHVAETQPDCARIIVSGYGEQLKVAEYHFAGHRYFEKPCDFRALLDFLIRLASFRGLITNEKVRRMVGGVGTLPGPPEMFLRLERLLKSPEATMQQVGALVEQDPAMTAKLMQIVNSASFGLQRKVLKASEAAQIVGLEALRGLVLGLQAFSVYNGRPGKKSPPPEIWRHSLRVGMLARDLAKARGLGAESCERAFLAGLLHEAGRLVIHVNAPEEHAVVASTARKFGISFVEAEWQRFGATGGEIGAYLLELWGIDEEVVMIVQYQESPAAFSGKEAGALAAVHLAHALEANDSVLYPLHKETLRANGFTQLGQLKREAIPTLDG